MDLLQLRTDWAYANLADACGWKRSGAGDYRRHQRLVSARLTGRKMDGFSLLWEGRQRSSAGQGRGAEPDVDERQIGACAGGAFRRPGYHQCAFMVSG